MSYDKLTPEGKRFYAEIEKLKKLQVRVGFQRGDATEEDGTALVDIAAWNELGNEHVPSRPFMRDSVDKHKDQINAFLKNQLVLLAQGKTDANKILNAIGVFQKGLVQKEIVDGEFAPNAPSTIRKKKSDKPLIDTGTMRQSVNYVITKKGDVK